MGLLVTRRRLAAGQPIETRNVRTLQTENGATVEVPEGNSAIAMISGFHVEYPQNHHVEAISIGAEGNMVVTGTEARFPNRTGAFMWDKSGHHQDNSRSSVDMTVFVLPPDA